MNMRKRVRRRVTRNGGQAMGLFESTPGPLWKFLKKTIAVEETIQQISFSKVLVAPI